METLVFMLFVGVFKFLNFRNFCSSHVLSNAEKTQFISNGWVNSNEGTVNRIVNQPNTFRSFFVRIELIISVELRSIGAVVVGGNVVGDGSYGFTSSCNL